jgi:hypothetical protein
MSRNISWPLLALLLACGTAQASNWVSIGKDAVGHEAFVDVSSIRVVGAIRRAWFKAVYVRHTMRETGGPDANKWWSTSVHRRAFNCGEETTRSEALTVYYEDGTNGSDPAANYPTPWEPVPPDTVLSTELQFICAWKAQ